MTLAISGASGFVGTYLQDYFRQKDHLILPITREDLKDQAKLDEKIAQSDVVINLSGATILRPWSKAYKKVLFESRIKTTKAIVSAINKLDKPPLLLSTSAIGIYKKDALFDEDTQDFSEGFLSHLCQSWESEALKTKSRLAILRFGVILGEGGALHKMLTPFKLGLGGRIASGRQAFSFIHIHDLARAYEHIIDNTKLSGLFNLSTPFAVDNLTLTRKLASKLKRPALLPLPAWLIKLIFSQGADTLIKGESVYPKHLLESGFTFDYPHLDDILNDLL